MTGLTLTTIRGLIFKEIFHTPLCKIYFFVSFLFPPIPDRLREFSPVPVDSPISQNHSWRIEKPYAKGHMPILWGPPKRIATYDAGVYHPSQISHMTSDIWYGSFHFASADRPWSTASGFSIVSRNPGPSEVLASAS